MALRLRHQAGGGGGGEKKDTAQSSQHIIRTTGHAGVSDKISVSVSGYQVNNNNNNNALFVYRLGRISDQSPKNGVDTGHQSGR